MIQIAIINEKGGVGKTTTAVNLAHGLGRRGHRVLLLDLDPQSNTTIHCGLDWRELEPLSIGPAMLRRFPDLLPCLVDLKSGVRLIPSSRRLRDVAHQLVAQRVPLNRLAQALTPLAEQFDYALMDLPPTLEVMQEMAIESAQRFLIPVDLGAFSIDGLTELIQHLHQRKADSPDWDFRILISREEGFSRATNAEALSALEPLRERLIPTHIRFNQRIRYSQIAGVDIFTHDARSRGARDFRALTRDIETLWPSEASK